MIGANSTYLPRLNYLVSRLSIEEIPFDTWIRRHTYRAAPWRGRNLGTAMPAIPIDQQIVREILLRAARSCGSYSRSCGSYRERQQAEVHRNVTGDRCGAVACVHLGITCPRLSRCQRWFSTRGR